MIQSRYEIPSVRGGARILRTLSTAGRPLGVSELSRALGLAKASVFRIVATLEMEGFVERVQGDAFKIGRVAFEVGSAYVACTNLECAFRPVAKRLVSEHNETIQLAILAGTEVIYVGKEESSQPVRLVSHLGTRLPAHITGLGKALLSQLTEQEVEELYGGTQLTQAATNSHASLESLLDDLRQIRERGWAHDNEEAADGLQCVASPILNGSGECVAAVSIAAPSQRMPECRLRQLGDVILEAALEISTLLGYRRSSANIDTLPDYAPIMTDNHNGESANPKPLTSNQTSN
jgi:DNA-binding IclR family transcriptional regulator